MGQAKNYRLVYSFQCGADGSNSHYGGAKQDAISLRPNYVAEEPQQFLCVDGSLSGMSFPKQTSGSSSAVCAHQFITECTLRRSPMDSMLPGPSWLPFQKDKAQTKPSLTSCDRSA
jgi:hypothetical protein